jgi:hypothetical protein
MKQVSITDEAWEYVRKIAFDTKQPIGKVISQAILNNIKE